MSKLSEEELGIIGKAVVEYRRERAEKDVLLHSWTKELQQKLEATAEKYGEIKPLAEVLSELINQIAQLRWDIQQDRERNVVLDAKELAVLEKLDKVLSV